MPSSKPKKVKCRYCKEYTARDSAVKVPLGYFCSRDHAAQHAIDKSQKERKKRERRDLAKRKEALKTKRDYIKEAQAAFNRYIRLRDRRKPCISCGVHLRVKYGGHYDCGHYRSTGAAPHLRFNVFNAAAQCVRCNRDLSGNVVEYRKELINRIGLELVERIEYDNEAKRFTVEYLKRLKKIFNKRANLYRKLGE